MKSGEGSLGNLYDCVYTEHFSCFEVHFMQFLSVMANCGIDVEVPEGLIDVIKTLINTNSSSQKEELALTTFLVLYIAICCKSQ